MKRGKRWLSMLLAAAMVLSLSTSALAASDKYDVLEPRSWSEDRFDDIPTDSWYHDWVKAAYEAGLMIGDGTRFFRPDDTVTLAETITLAVRLHLMATETEQKFESGSVWYRPYVDFALKKGILTEEMDDYGRPATRLEYARILSKAIPSLTAINTVEIGAIPDVANDTAVYRLYRAGIMIGNDAKGTFNPDGNVTRSEVSTAAVRIAQPDLRQSINLTTEDDFEAPVVPSTPSTSIEPEPPDEPSSGEEDKTETPETPVEPETPENEPIDENNALSEPFDLAYPDLFAGGEYAYSGEQILIKLASEPTGSQQKQLNEAGVSALELIMTTSQAVWYKAFVSVDVEDAMEAVRALSFVVLAEYDYVYETDTIIECDPSEMDESIKGNNYFDKQWYLRSCGLHKGWDHLKKPHTRPHYDEEQGESGLEDGEEVSGVEGGEGIVVAVIDTGVDYTHEDLKDNIWINAGEIPNNGKDDDGNGYIDDYYGYDAVAGKGSGMDDNGHGTHVAGIIAASNNNMGIVGIAYNAQIMTIKAGMASGYFNQSDVAEAIVYACTNGADVINMSFGGSASTLLVQEALEDAYTHCILVAAAGNDGLPNEVSDKYNPLPTYPAALTYVLGVMSVDSNGVESSFSNWDTTAYNSKEYELYAPGDQMISTIPGNRYATWSGTSMAAPVVSAMAALLRSEFRDRGTYPTKFIYGQLCSTSGISATCCDPVNHTVLGQPHNLPQIVDIYSALTKLPNPEVSVSDYALFDTSGLLDNEKNNGDGVIDAGETIALGFELRNRWGKSANTTITVETKSQVGITDPYITIHNESINIGSVGTYSTYDGGRVMENDQFVAWENPIYITVSPDCPNDYIFTLNVTVTCQNGLDSEDTTVYSSEYTVNLNVRRGVVLPSIIEEDMTLTADNYYIIPNATLIAEGASVTVEAGTNIQFWSDDSNDSYADQYIAYLNVEGQLIVNGTAENPVNMFPGERMNRYRVEITEKNNGIVSLYYTDVVNPYITVSYAEGCKFSQNYLAASINYRYLSSGAVKTGTMCGQVIAETAVDCAYAKLGGNSEYYRYRVLGSHLNCVFIDSAIELKAGSYNSTYGYNEFIDCLFYGNSNYFNNTSGSTSGLTLSSSNSFSGSLFTDEDSGCSYFLAPNMGRAYQMLVEAFGGSLACINSAEELAYIKTIIYSEYYDYKYAIGLEYNEETGAVRWADGTAVKSFIKYTKGTNPNNQAWIRGYYSDQHIEVAPATAATRAIYEFPARYVESITLDSYAVTMETESAGYQICASGEPLGISGTALIYRSMDESVAKVDDTGFITPVGVGEAEIRVYSPDMAVYNYLTVTVYERVELQSISLGVDFTISLGEQVQLTPILTPADTTQKCLTYSSSNTAAITVSQTGLVTGVGNGTAVITATNSDSGISASITVVGIVPVKSISLKESVYVTNLDSMETVDVFGINVSPSNATCKDLIWETSNPEIIHIDENGNLVKSALGNAVLRATVVGTDLYAEILITVTDQASEVTVIQLQNTKRNSAAYAYALLSDGTLWYWGNDVQVPLKLDFENVAKFAVSQRYLMILDKEGTLNVYYNGSTGNPENWQLYNTPIYGNPVTGVVDITSNGETSPTFFYLLEDGTVWGWGTNNMYQLGDGTNTTHSKAIQINVNEFVTDIQACRYNGFLAMLTEDGIVYYTGYYANSTRYKTPVIYTSNVIGLYECYSGIIMEYADSLEWYRNPGTDTYEKSGTGWAVKNNMLYFVDEDGLVHYTGNGTGTVNGLTNAAQVFHLEWQFTSTIYIQTADGKFYGMGNNEYYHIPNLSSGYQNSPSRIFFGLSTIDVPPTIEITNIEEETLADESILLDFDQAIISGVNYAYLRLTDSEGQLMGIQKTLKLDKCTISPAAEFTPGETYTLTIPAETFTNHFGVANEAITYTFTVAESSSVDETDAALASTEEQSLMDSSESVPDSVSVMTVSVINETQANPEYTGERDYLTLEKLQAGYEDQNVNDYFFGNAIINRLDLSDVTRWLRAQGASASSYAKGYLGHNYWGTTNTTLIGHQILDFDDFQTLIDLDESNYLTTAPENVWPFAVNAGLINKDGDKVTIIGNELVTFFVEFNRDMETSIPLDVRFGSTYPYGDYQVEGEWVSARRWEGTTTLTTLIEAGYEYWSIQNGHAVGKPHLTLFDDWGRFPFEIDTTEALAMTLQGEAGDEGITLTWTQDDFDTLMGYNVYRAEQDEDAYYQKLNSTIIPYGTETYFDDTVEPGKVYYYIFTVVKTDFSESEPSGKIRILSKDTMSPVLYHTPVYTAYEGSNIVISATASDNLQLASVTVHYRIAGTDAWIQVEMSKLNNKYSAVISGDKVTMAGIEYYVTTSDGINTVSRGSADVPYTIVVKEDPGAQMMGDVNGDGSITLLDALMHLQAVNDRLTLTDEQFTRADLNEDGVISASESLRILQYINGKIGSLAD